MQPSDADLLLCELTDKPHVREQLVEMRERLQWEPDPYQRDLIVQRMWRFVRELRGLQGGRSIWGPLLVAGGTAIAVVIVAASLHKTKFYHYPEDYLQVIENVDPCEKDGTCGYRRVMQEVMRGVPQLETEMNFCQKPRFEAGHILAWIRLIRRGSCTEIDGFDVVRDSRHLPKLAPNCWPDYSLAPFAGHIACPEGRAKF